ncbi:cytochrome c [Motiliproteus coralliicola]|uniref:Cytochrome c n=1 Tax=Motiliproteus coralliicola TaxID=2283196 RepID=A0A369WDP3_9GAMM|nr:cytochrome c [Motiliproteus coralliicola]RDE19413.1 cytochrome c [Motiliproteus coralliicola]
MKHLAKLLVSGAVAASVASTVYAAEPFEEQIKARQGFYQVVKFNMETLGDMVKGKRDYDPVTAEAAAKNIYSLSTLNNSMLWPKGSDSSAADTHAKAEIWSNFADVKQKHKAWNQAAEKLAANAGKGMGEMKASFGPVGKSCKSCHDDYKTK